MSNLLITGTGLVQRRQQTETPGSNTMVVPTLHKPCYLPHQFRWIVR